MPLQPMQPKKPMPPAGPKKPVGPKKPMPNRAGLQRAQAAALGKPRRGPPGAPPGGEGEGY